VDQPAAGEVHGQAPHYERRRVGKTRYEGRHLRDGTRTKRRADRGMVFDQVVKPIRRNIASVGLGREEMDLKPD